MSIFNWEETANILVVDDTPDNLRLLDTFLNSRGYNVRLSRDGNFAVKSALEDPPDLILLDIMMPILDGYEVCSQLKAHERTREIPIIFISAKEQVFDKVKAFSLGGVDYITKPFELEEVGARIENQLKIWKLSQALTQKNSLLQTEINERQRVEIALKQSEEKYRALVESSQDLIWSVDLEGRYTFINAATRKIYGYFPEEMIGRKFTEFQPPEQQAKDLEVFRKLLLGVSISQYETLHLNKDHQPIYLLFNAQPLRNTEGKVIGITGTATNITERKQAEKQLRLQSAAMAAATDGIALLNPQGEYLYLNETHVKLFGYNSPSDLLGKSWELLYPETELQRLYQEAVPLLFEQGSVRLETTGLRQDGTLFSHEASVTLLESGERICIIRDITERKKVEEALQKAVIAADIANRSKSEFLANMSHELRTPLNAILGFAQLMNNDLSLKAEHQRHLEIINHSGNHLLELINDILEMSKIEAGRVTLNQTNFDLISLLKSLQNILHIQAVKKGLKLIFEICPHLPEFVQTDEGKLRQVLLNILGNALKFTPTGCITLRVKLKAETEANPLPIIFEIEDTGSGISPEEMNHLFQAFGQTETGRKHQGGTGLGLAISRKFIQLMGGDITVKSIVNQGTIFTFDILVQVVEAEKVQSLVLQHQIVGLAPQQPRYKILVVDDVLESRLLLFEILNGVGFDVKEAENGLQAIEMCRNWKPHLIVMDMRMPVMNGLEATQIIKSNLQGQNTAIIAVTASAFEEDRAMILSVGCDDFIRKPFQREELLERIKQHLGVQYTYQNLRNFERNNPKMLEILTSEDIKFHLDKMPPKWVEQLYQCASQCTDTGILVLLKQIPSENTPLAETLVNLVENFQFDKILALLGTPNFK